MSARPVVAVYRDMLLSYSETFVATQAESLERYEAFYVGRSRVRGGIPLHRDSVILEDCERFPRLQKFRSTLGAGVPPRWLKAVQARSPGLIHVHFGSDGVRSAALARALGVPRIVTFHGFDILTRPGWSPKLNFYSILRRAVFRDSDLILASSDFVRRRLIAAGCPEERALVHYIGVDTSVFAYAPRAGRENVVLFVGRLVEMKGCRYLIEAMARLPPALGLRLVIVGSGPEDGKLRRLARTHGVNALFTGPLPLEQVAAWMRRALVFSVPSVTLASGYAEAFGLVNIQAQSCGLPVVSTTHGGIPEAVENGVTGLLVPERDPARLAAAIAAVASSAELWQELSVRGRERIERRFDLRSCTAKLEELYDEAARRAKALP